MFQIISIFFSGILLGYVFRRISWFRHIGRTISWIILLLLFLLGCAVGGNEQIVRNFSSLGGQALLFAGFTTLGSMLCAWVVYRFFFRKGGRS